MYENARKCRFCGMMPIMRVGRKVRGEKEMNWREGLEGRMG